jgi:hypothetical protein
MRHTPKQPAKRVRQKKQAISPFLERKGSRELHPWSFVTITQQIGRKIARPDRRILKTCPTQILHVPPKTHHARSPNGAAAPPTRHPTPLHRAQPRHAQPAVQARPKCPAPALAAPHFSRAHYPFQTPPPDPSKPCQQIRWFQTAPRLRATSPVAASTNPPAVTPRQSSAPRHPRTRQAPAQTPAPFRPQALEAEISWP